MGRGGRGLLSCPGSAAHGSTYGLGVLTCSTAPLSAGAQPPLVGHSSWWDKLSLHASGLHWILLVSLPGDGSGGHFHRGEPAPPRGPSRDSLQPGTIPGEAKISAQNITPWTVSVEIMHVLKRVRLFRWQVSCKLRSWISPSRQGWMGSVLPINVASGRSGSLWVERNNRISSSVNSRVDFQVHSSIQ